MLKDKVVFIFGLARFDSTIESTSYTTAKFLAQSNDVYYIDYPYTLKDYFQKSDEPFTRRKTAFFSQENSLLNTDIERLKILIVPPLLSINFLPEGKFYRFLLKVNEYIILKRIKRLINSVKIKESIFINSFNFHYPNIGARLHPKLYVYHCVDPLIVEYDRRHGTISEGQIVKKCDLVICTSRQLYREKVLQNPNTYFIPNAADLTLSSLALDEKLPVFSAIKSISKPIVGYFGNIERRINFTLVEEIVEMNPKINFVFAGPVDDSYIPDGFREKENVHFIGSVPFKEMPAVLKGFDVAIIPFRKDEVSATIFPLKLFEYLGAGKAVVATDFNADLIEFTKDTVAYCKTAEEFSNMIHKALATNSPEQIRARVDIAAENTWGKRLKEFSDLILRSLKS